MRGTRDGKQAINGLRLTRRIGHKKGECKINNIAKYVVCPFYHSDQQGKILCEGVQDKAFNHLVFQNCLDKKPYMMKFCCCSENYENCRIYDMLNLKHLMEEGKPGDNH